MSPERWFVVRARPAPGVDDDGSIAGALIDLGGRAAHFDGGWWVTHFPEADLDTTDLRDWRDRVAGYVDPGGVEVEVGWQEHQDWAELWKRGLEPRRIGTRLVVTPSWCDFEAGPDDLVVVLDPGMAFGNAEHGTTRSCLRLLEGAVAPGDRILDVGAGSGVLAIAAVRLGAAHVTAVEADPLATPTARENVAANGVADCVDVVERRVDRDDLSGLGTYDGVVANIERGVLVSLMPGLVAAVGAGGWLILSGIPLDEWSVVADAAGAAGVEASGTDTDGEWRSGRFVRPVDAA